MNEVLLVDEIDGKNRFVIRPIDMTDPEPGDVRFQVHAIGLNRSDLTYLLGAHYAPTVVPSRVGSEACGIVTAVGAGVQEYQIGDRVCVMPFGDPKYGVAGEFALSPKQYLAPWPEGYSAAEAAGAWMQYLTAYFPIHELSGVAADDAMLVTAASSSAGLGAIQLGKLLGVTVLANTRTAAKRDFLLSAGADHVIVTDDGDLAGQIMACTNGRGVRMVYEAVAGDFLNSFSNALAMNAQIFVYGSLGGSPTIAADIMPLIRADASIRFHSLITHMRDPASVCRSRDFIVAAMRSGTIRPVIDKVFRFEDALEAYSYMESGAQQGKIVMTTKYAATDQQ